MEESQKIIKICGITRYIDAKYSFDLGANYIGFVLHTKSPRFCPIERLVSIMNRIPNKKKVFVFGYDTKNTIISTFQKYRDKNTYLQLPASHSHFTEIISNIDYQLVIPAISIKKPIKKSFFLDFRPFPFVILDSPPLKNSNIPGGTGKVFSWDYIPSDIEQKFLLAGGLNVDNIQRAIQETNANGFDVASGVEEKPGCKEYKKLEKFIRCIRQIR